MQCRCGAWLLSALLAVGVVLPGGAQPLFGGPDDIAYAAALWQSLTDRRLAGRNALESRSYAGVHPHGAVQQVIYAIVSVVGADPQSVIVTRNFGGAGVSIQAVAQTPDRYLQTITVMHRRPGYDPANQDWFWVRYLPDGSLDRDPRGVLLAGRVDRGNPQAGCIACHAAAPGGNMQFLK